MQAGRAEFDSASARRIHLAAHHPHQHDPPLANLSSSQAGQPSSEASSAGHHRQAEAHEASSNSSAQPPWLATGYNRTLYFQPLAGLGNRLRALGEASCCCITGVRIWAIERLHLGIASGCPAVPLIQQHYLQLCLT